MKKTFVAFVLSAFAATGARAEVQWAPFLDAEVFGGRSTFSGDDVDGLNGSLRFVPGLRLSEKLSLLPALAFAYRKSRDVQELAGGGFLTQQAQTRSASLKGIHALGDSWKGKAYVSYRQELLKETSDEDWGDGLFDHDKTAVGLEAEREGSLWKSLRFGLDYYQTRFPNFQTLASKQLGSEINAGTDVLDFDSVDGSLGADLSLGQGSLLSSYLLVSNRDFSDQKIVRRDGTFSGDLRNDLYSYLSLGWRRQLPTVSLFGMGVESLAGVDASYARLDSNQHSYDASRTRFNENYYDYGEIGGGPRINLRFKEKLSAGFAFIYSVRDYAARPVQNVDGSYPAAGEAISTKTNTFRWSLGYPLVKGLSARLQGALQHADSNMDYETVYRYNYSSSSYFAGLAYQF
ncbi:MAG: hypothetical protein ACT4O3_02970 [Elusimicrobiota bacterium]